MRSRFVVAAALLALLVPTVALAQEVGEGGNVVEEGEEAGGQESTGQGEGAGGQGQPEAETGAGEGETEGAGGETGPQWTYQMARLSLALLIFALLGIGYAYYRFVFTRQRAGI
jgi:hypothetical protein